MNSSITDAPVVHTPFLDITRKPAPNALRRGMLPQNDLPWARQRDKDLHRQFLKNRQFPEIEMVPDSFETSRREAGRRLDDANRRKVDMSSWGMQTFQQHSVIGKVNDTETIKWLKTFYG